LDFISPQITESDLNTNGGDQYFSSVSNWETLFDDLHPAAFINKILKLDFEIMACISTLTAALGVWGSNTRSR